MTTLRDKIIAQAKDAKKVIRKVLALHHPDVGGSPLIYSQVKPKFDDINSIISKLDNCPDVLLGPFCVQIDDLVSSLSSVGSISAPSVAAPAPAPAPAPKKTAPAQKPFANQFGSFASAAAASTNPTSVLYTQLADIVAFLADRLFNRNRTFAYVLPLPMIRFQVKPKMLGYMTVAKNWQNSSTGQTTYELGLNPTYFQSRGLLDLFNTVAHELVHEYCSEVHGSSTTYHDKNWQAVCNKIGLRPIGSGVSVDTEIVSGGVVDLAYLDWMYMNPGFSLDWFSLSSSSSGSGSSNGKSKQKFTCPNCHQNAWAKPTARFICAVCDVYLVAA